MGRISGNHYKNRPWFAQLESGKWKSGSNESSYNTIIMRNKSN